MIFDRKQYRSYRDPTTGLMFCPQCNGIYYNRRKGRCPHCGIPLYLPGDKRVFTLHDQGYFWRCGKWHRISDLK